MKIHGSFVLILFCLNVTGQSKYEPGTVFSAAGDSIRGYLNFKQRSGAPAACNFKATLTDTPVVYVPGSITAFRLEAGGYFISRSIGRTSDVFLEVLVKGEMSLYKFSNIYFVDKRDSAFFELSDEMDVMLVEGEEVKRKSRNYQRMLTLLMSDCAEASKEVSKTTLKEKPLVKLVTIYNTCKGSPSYYYRVKTTR